MKYLITESQFDKIIFKYLYNQDFIQVEKNNRIYFVNSEGDKYAQIRYDKEDGWCYVYYKLIEEISHFFSIEEFDSEQIIGSWVENTLQMRVTNTFICSGLLLLLVENTLQMRVTNTRHDLRSNLMSALRIPSN